MYTQISPSDCFEGNANKGKGYLGNFADFYVNFIECERTQCVIQTRQHSGSHKIPALSARECFFRNRFL